MPPVQDPNNPYHFILSPQQNAKKSLLPVPQPSSKKGRILTVCALLVVVFIVFSLVSSLLSSQGKASQEQMVSIAARQQELIRVSTIGAQKAKSQEAKNLALTTQFTLTTDQIKLQATMLKSGIKLTSIQLNSRKNIKTDAQLIQADQTNQFDEVFSKTVTDELTSYQQAISTAFKQQKGPVTRALLTTEFNNAAIIIGPKTDRQS